MRITPHTKSNLVKIFITFVILLPRKIFIKAKFPLLLLSSMLMQKPWKRFEKYANNTTKNVKSAVTVSRCKYRSLCSDTVKTRPPSEATR